MEPYNFSSVIDGVLTASGYIKKLTEMQFLRDRGVRHVVCLAPDFSPPPDDVIKVHIIPVDEFEAPSLQQIITFITICQKALNKQQGVHVCCRMGRGRTGVMLACYLVRFKGLIPQAAITNIRFQRPYSVETYEQEFAVKTYYDYWTRTRN